MVKKEERKENSRKIVPFHKPGLETISEGEKKKLKFP
jgi:hypothetical protein